MALPDAPDGKVIVFTVPDFSAVAEWVKEVADYRDAVKLCPFVVDTPVPGSLDEAAGLDATRYHNVQGE